MENLNTDQLSVALLSGKSQIFTYYHFYQPVFLSEVYDVSYVYVQPWLVPVQNYSVNDFSNTQHYFINESLLIVLITSQFSHNSFN